MITLTCEQCGKPYQTKPYMAQKSKLHFCGFACYGAWQKTHRVGVGRKRVIVTCHTCGKAIERQLNTVKDHNFCGRQCWAEWRSSPHWSGANSSFWLGGHDDYRGPNWNRQSRAARSRDNNTCQHCGYQSPDLSAHHIRPFRLFTDYKEANKLENLTTLCKTCHTRAEWDFWLAHPELMAISPFPIINPAIKCRACNKDFLPKSGASAICDDCCMSKCEHCGIDFYSRRSAYRKTKYCSKKCRNDHVRQDRKTICQGCGKEFIADRAGARYCSHPCFQSNASPFRKASAKRKTSAHPTSQDADDTAVD